MSRHLINLGTAFIVAAILHELFGLSGPEFFIVAMLSLIHLKQ